MTSMRRGAKALGLSLLSLLSLMAVLAAGAQGNWLVEGKELTVNETVEFKSFSTIKFIVTNKNLEIQCPVAAGSGLELIGKSSTAEGKVKLSSCKTFSPPGSGNENKNCNPIEQPVVRSAKYKLILHNSKNYVLEEDIPWNWPFGELCALTETTEAKGSVVHECGEITGSGAWNTVDCSFSSVAHLMRVADPSLFSGDKYTFGALAASWSGITSWVLLGPNSGKLWAGHV